MALAMRPLTVRPASQQSSLFGRPFETRVVRLPTRVAQQAKIIAQALPSTQDTIKSEEISRKDFPSDFIFGVGCSAFQVEGAPTEGGRGNTVWDSFVHLPGKIRNGDLNYPGCDFYHRYEEDIQMVKDLGFDSFRFSISWTRIYPSGAGPESPEGIEFYNRVINAVTRAGLKPLVTLFHWETPQYLENDPNVLGWRTKNILPHFVKLAETCFNHFGDRVKHWTTINEVSIFSIMGYAVGTMAPGRCSAISGNNCFAGDSQTEPYLVAHHLILAHAKVYQLYKNKYKEHQGGVCGYAPAVSGADPYSNKEEDIRATQRFLEFVIGWQIDPVIFGDYPKSMRDSLGKTLPTFTKEESEELKNSCDFLGYNYYTAAYIKHADLPKESERWYANAGGYSNGATNADGKLIGPLMGPIESSWIYNCPAQLLTLLEWMEDRYGKIDCYILENGVMDKTPNDKEEALNDQQRCTYIKDHLTVLSKAIREKGINLKGYSHWSIIDNFELNSGFYIRFGIVRVEFEDGKAPIRTPKASANWFKKFLTE